MVRAVTSVKGAPVYGSAAFDKDIDFKAMTLNKSMIQAAKPVTAPASVKPYFVKDQKAFSEYYAGPVPASVAPVAPVMSNTSAVQSIQQNIMKIHELMNTGQAEARQNAAALFEAEKAKMKDYVKNPMKYAPKVAQVASVVGGAVTVGAIGSSIAKAIQNNKKQKEMVKPIDEVVDEVKQSARGIVTGTTGALNDSIIQAKQSLREKIAGLINPKEVVQAGSVPGTGDNKMYWIFGILLAILTLTRIK